MRTIFLLGLVLLSACNTRFFEVEGNGHVVAEQREVTDFSEVYLQGSYQVMLTEGTTRSLEIETDENLQEYIKVRQEGDALYLESKENLHSNHGILVNLVYTRLEKVEVSGAAELSNFGTLSGDGLILEISGAGQIDLKVDLASLHVATSGAGQVNLSGQADRAKIDLSGAGGVNAYDLTTSRCEVSVSGVGGAQVYATESLVAEVSGIGGILYKGQPETVQSSVSGLGDIRADE